MLKGVEKSLMVSDESLCWYCSFSWGNGNGIQNEEHSSEATGIIRSLYNWKVGSQEKERGLSVGFHWWIGKLVITTTTVLLVHFSHPGSTWLCGPECPIPETDPRSTLPQLLSGTAGSENSRAALIVITGSGASSKSLLNLQLVYCRCSHVSVMS